MLVTIYIPTKDRAEALAVAVDSVLCQTYQEFELIVVNDGATDSTEKYLADLTANDSRVRAINNLQSYGAPAARNRAIREARGFFVTGLDDDDHFQPDRLASFVSCWESLKANGVTPSCLYSQDLIIEGNDRIRLTKKAGQVRYEDLFSYNCIGNQIFAPRSHFIESGLFDESLRAWQDLEFFMRVVKNFGPAHLLDAATYIFDDSPRVDRISHKSPSKIYNAFEQVALKHAPNGGMRRQQLFLQVFAPYYGFRPRVRDWIEFVKGGFWLTGMLRLLKATVKNASH